MKGFEYRPTFLLLLFPSRGSWYYFRLWDWLFYHRKKKRGIPEEVCIKYNKDRFLLLLSHPRSSWGSFHFYLCLNRLKMGSLFSLSSLLKLGMAWKRLLQTHHFIFWCPVSSPATCLICETNEAETRDAYRSLPTAELRYCMYRFINATSEQSTKCEVKCLLLCDWLKFSFSDAGDHLSSSKWRGDPLFIAASKVDWG